MVHHPYPHTQLDLQVLRHQAHPMVPPPPLLHLQVATRNLPTPAALRLQRKPHSTLNHPRNNTEAERTVHHMMGVTTPPS